MRENTHFKQSDFELTYHNYSIEELSHCNTTTLFSMGFEHNLSNGDDQIMVTRRSANYKPSVWDYNYVQSLSSDHTDKKNVEKIQKLKEDIKSFIHAEMDPLAKMELIDAVQRLGLQYHFVVDIKNALKIIYENEKDSDSWINGYDDLYFTALRFRLLRMHGYHVSQDVFEKFMDEKGNFDACLQQDAKGFLSLYEASFHGLKGETTMDKAKILSRIALENQKDNLPPSLARKGLHALDMPIHWRPNRVEARWFIDMYQEEQGMNPILLEMAKLDYNMVQSTHRNEVAKLARWWVDLGLSKMEFCRDRLMEHYLWNAIMVFEPQYEAFREMSTKITCMITMFDDIYDIYGSLDELVFLTDLVERWDVTEINKLPPTMQTCYLAMYNTSNDIGYRILRERGFNVIPFIRQMWNINCKTWLREAKWYNSGYKPTLEEYLDTAVPSIGGFMVLFFSYFITTDKIDDETMECMCNVPRIMHCSTMILRLNNDLATSSDELARGDNFKSIQCYMKESGTSEQIAREYIKIMVHQTWKTMNEDGHDDKYSSTGAFIDACLNLARASQAFYQYGDGHGRPDSETKEHLKSLLVKPLPME